MLHRAWQYRVIYQQQRAGRRLLREHAEVLLNQALFSRKRRSSVIITRCVSTNKLIAFVSTEVDIRRLYQPPPSSSVIIVITIAFICRFLNRIIAITRFKKRLEKIRNVSFAIHWMSRGFLFRCRLLRKLWAVRKAFVLEPTTTM